MVSASHKLPELGAAVKTWRDRLSPEQAGVLPAERRRVPGLRRRELAQLAGVSVDYLTQIEQGRAGNPSPSVLAALARVLRLSDAERTYFYALAGYPDPAPDAGARDRDTPPAARRLLAELDSTPAAIYSRSWDLLDWNAAWSEVHGNPAPRSRRERNLAIMHFTGKPTRVLRTAGQAADFSAALAADLRATAARHSADAKLSSLVRLLVEDSPGFRCLWDRRAVGSYAGEAKTIETAGGGTMRFQCDVLTMRPRDDRLVIYTEGPRRGGPDLLHPRERRAHPHNGGSAAARVREVMSPR